MSTMGQLFMYLPLSTDKSHTNYVRRKHLGIRLLYFRKICTAGYDKKVSEYDQEITQPYTADPPTAT